MNKEIKSRFNKKILNKAIRCFVINKIKPNLLDGFENFIYEFKIGNREYILRISHSMNRSESVIQAEVDWINYLADNSANVAKAIYSLNGKLVEHIKDDKDGYFLVTAFNKAHGKKGWENLFSGTYNKDFLYTYGQTIGKFHKLTKIYTPPYSKCLRPLWNDDTMIKEVENILKDVNLLVYDKNCKLIDHFNSLPKNKNDFGLIHFDAHGGNFLVDDKKKVTMFDFDDCNYNWFINDIAIVLFYTIDNRDNDSDHNYRVNEFLPAFLKGYSRENKLDRKWLKEIPKFLKFREIDLYALIHRSFDINNLHESWCINYMRNRKYKLENDVPYIDIDFEKFAEFL